jgi:DNA-binding MarR family transcriptional regulator
LTVSDIVKYLDLMSPNGSGRDPLTLCPQGPTSDWRVDVNRPPLGSLVGMLFRALVDRLRDKIVELGGEALRPSQLYILRSLHPQGASVTELAERCEITKQAVSQLLDGLERIDLVRRAPDPSDARSKIVTLTERGEYALATAVRAWGEVEKEWADLLGGQEGMQAIRRAMFRFIETHAAWRGGEKPRLRPVW